MQPWTIITVIGLYFLLLLYIGWVTGKEANKEAYFLGNRQSIWWLVAFGMLSDSMSGVSFISVPGDVHKTNFFYMQTVLGYLLGYVAIAFVLLPLYYKLQLTSIYSYLGSRFGISLQKTGAAYFVLSRLIGSAGRLFLTAAILQTYLFQAWGFPFWASVSIIILLILAYTIKGGIKTLVFTDAIQSAFLLAGLILCVGSILHALPGESAINLIVDSPLNQWFNWNVNDKTYFWKHFLGGAFICITMTGLDQNMMQKNLSCRSLKDAQKNILSYGAVVFLVNVVFLSLGILMFKYMETFNISAPLKNGQINTDGIFPMLALQYLGTGAGLAFILGLAAATFSSADSVLTTLTTSTYIDFLHLDKHPEMSDERKKKMRNYLHAGFAVLLLFTILLFKEFNSDSLITTVLKLAGFTYGPLLGLFAFGILTNRKVDRIWSVVVCIVAPIITFLISMISPESLNGYQFGFELLIINGLITFIGLMVISIFNKNDKIVLKN